MDHLRYRLLNVHYTRLEPSHLSQNPFKTYFISRNLIDLSNFTDLKNKDILKKISRIIPDNAIKGIPKNIYTPYQINFILP